MTEVVKVTSKGQITLPIKIRKAIGIGEDSFLLVEQIGDYVLMKKAEVRMKEINRILGEEAKRKNITRKELLLALEEAKKETWAE
ncbi:MAG: AbrB/MazE/SpoVT family DNA-binding domain-containing protein [Thermoplasmata archaeon]|nr:AbrB/MazE/SpoVT family DNA-binding domain-containing protein [Thermoplasmata archaeon]